MRRRRFSWTSLLTTLVTLVVIAGGLYLCRPLIAKMWLKSLLYVLQERVEQYKGANGYYPDHLADLEELENYHLPLNPLSVLNFKRPQEVKEVKLGQFTPGGLVYYPYVRYGRRLDAYFLGIYGLNEKGGIDRFKGEPKWDNIYEEGETRDGVPEGLVLLLTEPERSLFQK